MSADNSAFERAVLRETALSIANEWANRDGISIEIEEMGDQIKTVFCKLYKNGCMVANGSGKGIGLQSRASALFEAIEHYYSIFSKNIKVDAFSDLDIDGYDKILDNGSPPFRRICGINKLPLSRTNFVDILNQESMISFPTFLLNPDFESEYPLETTAISQLSIKRYSTNSGIAAGCTIEEAVLHGLLETIERDALGIAILRAVLRKPPLPLRRIIIDHTIPDVIKELVRLAEDETGGKITVWDITNDTSVPCMLARIQIGCNLSPSYFGSGASLSSVYAVERAILEAVQHYHLMKRAGREPPTMNNESLSRLPKYLKCALSKGIFYPAGGESDIYLTEIHDISASPGDQIKIVSKLLSKVSARAYMREIYSGPPYVSQVVAPMLERVHLIARGVPVMPGFRGEKYLL